VPRLELLASRASVAAADPLVRRTLLSRLQQVAADLLEHTRTAEATIHPMLRAQGGAVLVAAHVAQHDRVRLPLVAIRAALAEEDRPPAAMRALADGLFNLERELEAFFDRERALAELVARAVIDTSPRSPDGALHVHARPTSICAPVRHRRDPSRPVPVANPASGRRPTPCNAAGMGSPTAQRDDVTAALAEVGVALREEVGRQIDRGGLWALAGIAALVAWTCANVAVGLMVTRLLGLVAALLLSVVVHAGAMLMLSARAKKRIGHAR
jgi:hypothetical protein